jgi:hypothetical protein
MVLRPIPAAGAVLPGGETVTAWTAVEETQRRPAAEYWLITQPDHAALAGELAARLGPPLLNALPAEVVRGIAVHDDGWAAFDAHVALTSDRRPLSFLDVPVPDFVRAWTDSIARAQQVAPIAGAIVSRHFCRLAQARASSRGDRAQDAQQLQEFLSREDERQQRLGQGESEEYLEFLTDVLQFCDLLSLYLCCGAPQDVEFSPRFVPRPLRLTRLADAGNRAVACRLDPSPFPDGVDVAVAARRYPPSAGEPNLLTLPFLLW